MKKFCCLLLVLITILFIGCQIKETNLSATQVEPILSDATINIKYCNIIKDKSQPLTPIIIKELDIYRILYNLNNPKNTSSNIYTITPYTYNPNNMNFRKCEIKGTPYYYCIYSTKNNDTKLYLFFSELSDILWGCESNNYCLFKKLTNGQFAKIYDYNNLEQYILNKDAPTIYDPLYLITNPYNPYTIN